MGPSLSRARAPLPQRSVPVPAKPSTKFTVLWSRCGRSRGYPPTASWHLPALRGAENRRGGRSRRRRPVSKGASAPDVRERPAEPDNERIDRPTAPPSVQPSNDPDQLALDSDVVVELGRVRGVGGLQSDLVL